MHTHTHTNWSKNTCRVQYHIQHFVYWGYCPYRTAVSHMPCWSGFHYWGGWQQLLVQSDHVTNWSDCPLEMGFFATGIPTPKTSLVAKLCQTINLGVHHFWTTPDPQPAQKGLGGPENASRKNSCCWSASNHRGTGSQGYLEWKGLNSFTTKAQSGDSLRLKSQR